MLWLTAQEGGPARPQDGDRQAYRRGGGQGGDKKADAGAGATTEFQFVSHFVYCLIEHVL